MSRVRPMMIAAGGTGGHVFPALAVEQVLRSRDIPVVWVGTARGLESRVVPAAGIALHEIPVASLRGHAPLATLGALWRLVGALRASLTLVRTQQPSVVLGMGGFVAGPVGLAAWLLRCPLVLHEQNATPGLTNRVLARVAGRALSAMPGAFAPRVNARVVGNPVRGPIATLERTPRSVAEGPLHLLVVGGSLGARILNQVVPVAVKPLGAAVAVRHQCGAHDEAAVREAYGDDSPHHIEPFIENMAEAYTWADLVVCRAGAMTVTELAAAARASILVPYPHATDDHQSLNAKYLADAGAAQVCAQPQFDAAWLHERLQQFIDEPSRLVRMSQAAASCFVSGAAEAVADTLQEVARP